MRQIYEILNEVANVTTKAEKIEVLRRNDSPILRTVLRGAYHPDVKFVFDKIPEYKTETNIPPGMGYTSMIMESKRFYIFVEGNKRVDPNLTLDRKKKILIQMLEALEPKEAEVLSNMLMKNLRVKGLNAEVALAAFPDLF